MAQRRDIATLSRHLLFAFLSSLLFVQAIRAFFAGVYYQNLVTLSINASILYTLLLLSPAVYLFLPSTHSGWVMVLSATFLGIFRVAMNLSWGSSLYLPLSGLAVAAFLILFPAMLRQQGSVSEGGGLILGVGLVLAFAIDSVNLSLGLSWDALSTHRLGLIITVPVAAVVTALAWVSKSAPSAVKPESRAPHWKTALTGLFIGAWLFLEYSILSSPHVIARWNSLSLPAVSLGTVLGLIVPVASTISPFTPPSRPIPMAIMSALTLAAFIDYSFVHSSILPVFILLAQATLVMALFHSLSSLQPTGLRQKAIALLYASLLLLLLLFASAFALTYYYVPLRGLWEGSEVVLILGAAIIALLAAAMVSKGFREPLRMPPLPKRLLAILIILPLFVAYAALVPVDLREPRPGTTLKVLTYNVHQGFNNAGMIDPGIFARVLEEADADLVALQESDTARFTSANLDLVGYLASTLGYSYYYGPPTREQSFGIALLSRYDILEASYELLTSTEDKRSLLEARIDVGGETVWVFVTHLAQGAQDRQVQAQEVLLRMSQAGGQHILAGDFNSCPSGLCEGDSGPADNVYEMLTTSYDDVWTEAGFAAEDSAGFTYSASNPLRRIDYIFVSDEVSVLAVERIRTAEAVEASDHLPVSATIQVGD